MRRDAKKARQVSAGSLTAAHTVAEARFWVTEMPPLRFQYRRFVSFQVRDSNVSRFTTILAHFHRSSVVSRVLPYVEL
jgi:hypothetical protein